VLGLWVFSFVISALQQGLESENVIFLQLKGLIYHLPIISSLLLISLLNIIGLPLFSLFPSKRILWSMLSADNLVFQIFTIIGFLGLITVFLRLLNTMIQKKELSATPNQENPLLLIPVILIVLVMLVSGIFPNFIAAPLQNLFISFENLIP
jgi:formate hydrogenlyase subunit 3/multisubunit Na+/H+ antiporter MnhD subunit